MLAVAGANFEIRSSNDTETYMVATLGPATVIIRTVTSPRDDVARRVEACAAAISAGLEAGSRVHDAKESRHEIDNLAGPEPWRRQLIGIGDEQIEVEVSTLAGGESAAFGIAEGTEFSIGTNADLTTLPFELVPRSDL